MKNAIKILTVLITALLIGPISAVAGYIWEAIAGGFQAGRDKFVDHAADLVEYTESLGESIEAKDKP